MFNSSSPFRICLTLVLFVGLVGIWSHFIGRLWLIYSLIIIFLGGIIIVFIYTASVNNRFKFLVNFNKSFLYSAPILVGISLRLSINRYVMTIQESVWRIFTASSLGFIILLGLIIIITLFTVVKLVQVDQGPLKT